jgi:uncharacterized damage-inducible protein DinB
MPVRIFLLFACFIFFTTTGSYARNTTQDSLPPFPSAVERLLNNIENSIISAAELMPDDKFDFTPEQLNIPGSDFKGVRTFAGQVKHLATDNYDIWSAITGDPLPPGIKDVNGPENLKTKADILEYLKNSFAEGHKAITSLTAQNAMEMLPFRGNKLARLDLAFYALTHDNDHYGQMVVYLRMCGINPSAPKK